MGNIFQKAYRFSMTCISTIHLHQYREKQMYQELNCATGSTPSLQERVPQPFDPPTPPSPSLIRYVWIRLTNPRLVHKK